MVSFTAREVRDILISMLVIAVIFAYLINGRNINENLIVLVPALLISVGLGFVLHELAHKFVAVRYGFFAEFKMWLEGLILALAMAFLIGFVFVAPGAVYIHGEHISREQNGKISIAGPLVNIRIGFVLPRPHTIYNKKSNRYLGICIRQHRCIRFHNKQYFSSFQPITIGHI